MDKLTRLTTNRTRLASIITCNAKSRNALIPGISSRCFSIGHIGFIPCKAGDQQRREGTENNIPVQLPIKKHWCQKSGTQKVHSGCVTVQIFRQNAIRFEKTLGFILRFFFSKNHEDKVTDNNGGRKKTRDQIQIIKKQKRQRQGQQTNKAAGCFKNMNITRIGHFICHTMKESIEDIFHVTSLKSFVNCTYSIAFLTTITK